MRWDIRRPWRPFGDRFVLSRRPHRAAHLRHAGRAQRGAARPRRARRGPALRLPRRRPLGADLGGPAQAAAPRRAARPRRDGGQDPLPEVQHRAVRPRHAARRRRGGGAQAGRGRGGQGLRGRGRGRPDARRRHETRNTAWGLGLDNLVFLLDWNDFGIDDPSISSVVHGTPASWFEGLRLARDRDAGRLGVGAGDARRAGGGARRQPGRRAVHGLVQDAQGPRLRQVRQQEPRHAARHERARVLGRAQGVHGASRRGRTPGVDEPAPTDAAERDAQARANFERGHGRAARGDATLVDRISDRLVEVAGTVPERVEGFNLGGHGAEIFNDTRFTDVTAYPAAMWKQPGEKAPNRAALGGVGRLGQRHSPRAEYGRPLFIACVGGPGRVDQHRRLRQGLARTARLGLVQPRHEPARRAAAAADHRVHQRRRQRRASPPSTWRTTR